MASPWACEWDRWVGGGEGGEQIRGFYNFQQGTNLPNFTTGEFQKPVLYFLLTQKGQVTVPELGTYHIFVQCVKALCCACYPRCRCFFITFLHASSPFCITLHYFSKTGDQRQETGHGRWKRRTGHSKWERGQVMGDGRGGQDTVYGRGGQKMGDWSVALFAFWIRKVVFYPNRRLAEDPTTPPVFCMRCCCVSINERVIFADREDIFLYKSCYSEADVSEMSAQYLSLGSRCCLMRSSGIRSVSERQTVNWNKYNNVVKSVYPTLEYSKYQWWESSNNH